MFTRVFYKLWFRDYSLKTLRPFSSTTSIVVVRNKKGSERTRITAKNMASVSSKNCIIKFICIPAKLQFIF